AGAVSPLPACELGDPGLPGFVGGPAGGLVGADADAWPVVARQGARRAGQELHPAERHLCHLRVRAIRTSRRTVAHAPPPRSDTPCSCGGVHRQYRLCGDGAYHPRGPGSDGGTVRTAAVRLERRSWCLPGRSRADRGGVGILALSACARFGGGRAGAKLWHQRRRLPGRLAVRILEEIACLRRRSTCYRAWDRNNSCTVP